MFRCFEFSEISRGLQIITNGANSPVPTSPLDLANEFDELITKSLEIRAHQPLLNGIPPEILRNSLNSLQHQIDRVHLAREQRARVSQ